MAELGVDIKKPINGAPPVFVAALNDRVEVVRLLADLGADIEQTYEGGFAPPFHGFTPSSPMSRAFGTKGFTPSMAAAHKGYVRTVSCSLSSAQTSRRQTASDGQTLVFIVADAGHEKVLKISTTSSSISVQVGLGGWVLIWDPKVTDLGFHIFKCSSGIGCFGIE